MFQAPDLTLIVEFIFMFYKEKPIDWLLDHILWVKVCNPEKDAVSQFLMRVGIGVLTTLPSSLAPLCVHLHSMTSLGATCSGPHGD